MENNSNESIFSLAVTEKLKEDFKTAGIWAVITAVIAFINAALSLVDNLKKGAFLMAFIAAAITVLINIYLLNFGRKIKAGITDANQDQVSDGLNDLRMYFKIAGILIIISLSIAILIILYVVFAVGLR